MTLVEEIGIRSSSSSESMCVAALRAALETVVVLGSWNPPCLPLLLELLPVPPVFPCLGTASFAGACEAPVPSSGVPEVRWLELLLVPPVCVAFGSGCFAVCDVPLPSSAASAGVPEVRWLELLLLPPVCVGFGSGCFASCDVPLHSLAASLVWEASLALFLSSATLAIPASSSSEFSSMALSAGAFLLHQVAPYVP